MTSHLSTIFKQSLLVTAMGLALAACGGGSGLGNDQITPPPPAGGGDGGGGSVTPTSDIEVRDFGGINGKVVWDANRDSFVVGTDGTFYVYNAVLGAPSPDSDLIPGDRLARVKGIKVTSDNALFRGSKQLGTIAADQATDGRQFYVLSFGTGSDQGYLDIDFNSHYGGFAKEDKTDPRITQVHAVAVEHSFQGLLGNSLWQDKDGPLALGTNLDTLPATDSDLNFSFKAPTSENYQFVLREFGYPYTDLDIRLIDVLTGRILASSYGTLDGEVISFPLTKDATYGVNVRRPDHDGGTEDASFKLSIKQSADIAGSTIHLPDLTAKGSSLTIRGTIHPVTRFEFCSRFPGIGDASGDASGDATSDSLFWAVRDASGDGSGDSSDDAFSDPISENQRNVDYFTFQSINILASQVVTHTFRSIAEGGKFTANYISTDSARTRNSHFSGNETPSDAQERDTKGNVKYDLNFGEYENPIRGYTDNTIEYEMVIERK